MALTRQQLTPLDGLDNRINWAGVLDRANRRLIRWVLGTGLLSFHLAIFTTVLLGTFTWNLISSPDDLYLMGPFRIWGVAALVHTLLVGGGLIGWRLFRMGESQAPRTVPIYAKRAVSSNGPTPARPAGWSQAWASRVSAAGRVNAAARRWTSASPHQTPAEPPALTATGWPAQAPIAASAAAGASGAERPPDVGEATWPESPPISTSLRGATDTRDPADQVVSVNHRPNQIPEEDSGRTWVDGFVESRTRDKENRWSWVEAAAASWLSKREVSDRAEKALSATSEPIAEDTAAPSEPERHDENAPSA